MVEMILERALDQPRRLGRGQTLLGLALELRLADEQREQQHGAGHDVLGGDLRRAAVVGELAIGLEAAGQPGAHPRLMRAAFRRGHGVAVEGLEAFLVHRPGDRPFDTAAFAELVLADEGQGGQRLAPFEQRGEIIGKPAGEMEPLLLRHLLGPVDGGVAPPADLDAAEEIGLGARHAVEGRRLELGLVAEDLRIGMEADRGAATIGDGAGILQFRLGLAARILLRPELLVARDLDPEPVGQRVDHRDADAVQPARGLVGVARELAAGMQRRQDDLERRGLGEFGMGVDRYAAAIVAYDDGAILVQLDLDAAGMAGHRLVHGIVEHFGGQMMQRPLVGAADIHAGPAAHRLEPFQHLDILGGIARTRLAGEIVEEVRHAATITIIENTVGANGPSHKMWS